MVVMAVMVVSLAGAAWRGAGETMHRFFGPPPDAVGRFAERASAWLDKTARALRERFAAVVAGVEVAAPEPARNLHGGRGETQAPGDGGRSDVGGAWATAPMDDQPIRIYRGSDAATQVYRGSGGETRIYRGSGAATQVYRGSGGETRVYRGSGALPKAGVLSGSARVFDGDTLEVGGVRVRLYGIDAPESQQSCRAAGRRWPCGHEAKRALANQIGTRRVACEARDRDSYSRVVAVCGVAGRELNRWMVAEGWALANRRYSLDYAAEESQARQASRGVWRGEVMAPWKWRRGERLAGGRQCGIKGNISRGGKRIYHVPGGKYYASTRIDTSRGERWFCTEREAQAAGWRRSRR